MPSRPTVTLTQNPAAGGTITIGSKTFTFREEAVGPDDVQIVRTRKKGPDPKGQAATLKNLLKAIEPALGQFGEAGSGGIIQSGEHVVTRAEAAKVKAAAKMRKGGK
jgi:hypothetical protein